VWLWLQVRRVISTDRDRDGDGFFRGRGKGGLTAAVMHCIMEGIKYLDINKSAP
jgi:hypothetical protein